ncbi:MAG: right-handed parallel beta-helix repeat-containing protein [Elusimicrobiota bacterium]|nr:right-handed parallel beta-helix repeat-containing protein [Elusimicrobiota bacterium]
MDNVGNVAAVKTALLNVISAEVYVECGGVLTQSAFLEGDLDCSGYTGAILTIGADNIVFDGRGYKIIAPDADTVIYASGRRNISVINVDVSDENYFGAGSGVDISFSSGVLVQGITATGREYGLKMPYGNSDVTITGNYIDGYPAGVYIGGGSSITITGNNLSSFFGWPSSLNADNVHDLYISNNDFNTVTLNSITDSVIDNPYTVMPPWMSISYSRNLAVNNGHLQQLEISDSSDMQVNNVMPRYGWLFGFRVANSTNTTVSGCNISGGLELVGLSGVNLNGFTWDGNAVNADMVEGLSADGNTFGEMTLKNISDSVISNSTIYNGSVKVFYASNFVFNNVLIYSGYDEIGLDISNSRDIVLDGTGPGGYSIGIRVSDSSNTRITNAYISAQNIGIAVSASRNTTLENIYLWGTYDWLPSTSAGLSFTDSTGINIVNTLTSNWDFGLKLEGNCGNTKILNDTLAYNNTGITISPACTGVSITNSILWNNNDDLNDQSGTAQVTYSDVQESLLPGVGNMHADPLFMGPPWDLRLSSGSPCIDAGVNTTAGLPATDLNGSPRLHDGNSDGNAVVDMGAYESQQSYFASTTTVNGEPELVLTSYNRMEVAQISTVSEKGSVVVAARGSGLVLVSNLYEVLPDGNYYPPAVLTFVYSTAALGGVLESELAVYEYFSDSGLWEILPDQTLDPVTHRITASVSRIASLFGIFGIEHDTSAPTVSISARGSEAVPGETVYITGTDSVTITAADPIVDGTASGVKEILYAVDAVFSTQTAVAYIVPFTVPVGTHTVYYTAFDNAGNQAAVIDVNFIVQPVESGPSGDTMPPVTTISFSTPSYTEDGHIVVPGAVLVYLSALDPEVTGQIKAGLATTYYLVDADTATAQLNVYLEPFGLPEGSHTIRYASADKAGNLEAVKSEVVFVDGAAPVSTAAIAGSAGQNGWFVSPVMVTLAATDGLSGVAGAYYSLAGSSFAVYSAPFSLSSEGFNELKYYAVDNIGNLEPENSLVLKIDQSTPMVSAAAMPAPNVDGWNNSAVSVVFTGTDAVSGVEECSFGIVSAEGAGQETAGWCRDIAGNTGYSTATISIDLTDPLISAKRSPLANEYGWNNTAVTASYVCTDGLSGVKSCPPAETLAGEGINQSVSGEALDYAGNRSSASVSGVNIDKIAPISAYRPEGMVYISETGKIYLNLAANISLIVTDPVSGGTASGIDAVEYYIDSAPFMVYASSFGLSGGIRTVYYRSRDKAGNIESAKSAEFHMDGTSPLTSLNISAPLYLAEGVRYITPGSVLSFAAADPLINDTASGVLLTKYRIDGGNWQVYLDSFSIVAEGLHTVEYYSMDRVQNAEAMKTAKLAVDNTPPATTISFGEPKAKTFGLPLLTPATKITLSAGDPVINGAASGLNSIFYEIENMQTGALTPVTAYLSPFTIPEQGTFIIRCWSRDNTGNTETAKEMPVSVTTWREEGLVAVSGLDMSGTADISGAVKSNAVVNLGGNARILGDVTASTITLAGKAQITGRQVSGAAPVNPAPINLAGIIQSAIAVNNNVLVSSSLVNGKLVLGSKASIVLSTGTYYFKGMELSGGSSITLAGKVDILVEGGISISGGSSLNASGAASLLSIIVSTSSELKFNGGAALAACVYAPYSDMKLTGNALLGGHYFVKTATVSGTSNILQSGEALPVAAAPTGGGIKTKAAAMPARNFSVLAGPDPEFRLGEVYVFPNPAKGSEAPVFHIETGIADSVKITIYTVSGRAAHEQTLTGLPTELDDGNGLSYAYEYTWRGHIPSGVYLYYIEAQKGGQKLKKTGKFAVVR